MPLDKRFVSARIKEVRTNVWIVEIIYSFYSLYEYKISHVADTQAAAMRWLLEERCGDSLQIINASNVNI